MNARDYQEYKGLARVAVLESYQRLADRYQTDTGRGRGLPRRDQSAGQRHRQHGLRRGRGLPGDPDRRHRPRRGLRPSGRHPGAAERQRTEPGSRASSSTAFAATSPCCNPAWTGWNDAPASRCWASCPFCRGCIWRPRMALPYRPVRQRRAGEPAQAGLRILVPALPRLSNHTDFDPPRLHPEVRLATSSAPARRYRRADLIILPGSKSVRGDLAWLRAGGLGGGDPAAPALWRQGHGHLRRLPDAGPGHP